eukprot:30992-Pelagococcus_subviridis.AAC.7
MDLKGMLTACEEMHDVSVPYECEDVDFASKTTRVGGRRRRRRRVREDDTPSAVVRISFTTCGPARKGARKGASCGDVSSTYATPQTTGRRKSLHARSPTPTRLPRGHITLRLYKYDRSSQSTINTLAIVRYSHDRVRRLDDLQRRQPRKHRRGGFERGRIRRRGRFLRRPRRRREVLRAVVAEPAAVAVGWDRRKFRGAVRVRVGVGAVAVAVAVVAALVAARRAVRSERGRRFHLGLRRLDRREALDRDEVVRADDDLGLGLWRPAGTRRFAVAAAPRSGRARRVFRRLRLPRARRRPVRPRLGHVVRLELL